MWEMQSLKKEAEEALEILKREEEEKRRYGERLSEEGNKIGDRSFPGAEDERTKAKRKKRKNA